MKRWIGGENTNIKYAFGELSLQGPCTGMWVGKLQYIYEPGKTRRKQRRAPSFLCLGKTLYNV